MTRVSDEGRVVFVNKHEIFLFSPEIPPFTERKGEERMYLY